MQKDECCPEFDPGRWDEKTHSWREKPFLKESMPAFFHIPFPGLIGKKVEKMYSLAIQENAGIDDILDWIILFHDPHPFKSEMYMAVSKSVPGGNNVTLSGEFISRVFDGPFNAVPKHIRDMNNSLEESGKKAKDYYIHYAYCPNCAKKFGHNYSVLFAEV